VGLAVTVRFPAALKKLTGGRTEDAFDAADLASLLGAIESRYPGVHARLFEEDGSLRRNVSILVNGDNARNLKGMATSLAPGDVVAIVPAIAGG